MRALRSPSLLRACLAVTLAVAAFLLGRLHARSEGAPTTETLAIEGTLLDGAGLPLSGLWNMTLRVFDPDSDGGTAMRTCEFPGTTVAADGRFTIPMNAGAPCVEVFRTSRQTAAELTANNGRGSTVTTARTRVHAVPYAMEADHTATATSATQAAGALESRIAALEARVTRGEATRAARVWIYDPPVGGLYYDRDSSYNVSNVERIALGRYRVTFSCPYNNYSAAALGPCETCRYSVAGIDARSVEVRVNEDAFVDGGIISRRTTAPPLLVTVLIAGTPLTSSTCTPP